MDITAKGVQPMTQIAVMIKSLPANLRSSSNMSEDMTSFALESFEPEENLNFKLDTGVDVASVEWLLMSARVPRV